MEGTLGIVTLSQPMACCMEITLVNPNFIPILTVGIFNERTNASISMTEPLYRRS